MQVGEEEELSFIHPGYSNKRGYSNKQTQVIQTNETNKQPQLSNRPIKGPSVVVQVGEEEEPPQVNGGDSSSVSKSSLQIFLRISPFVIRCR